MDAAAREATAAQRVLAATEDAAVLAKLERDAVAIVRLTDAERAAFAEAAAPVTAEWRARLGSGFLDYLG